MRENVRTTPLHGDFALRASAAHWWFDEPQIVEQFPRRYRVYAAYSQRAMNRRTGFIHGGSFLWRALAQLTRIFRLDDEVVLRIGRRLAVCDLLDHRMLSVIGEIGGQSPEERVLRALLGPGDTFVDIGANHGSFSIIAGELVGSDGLVIAIEPQERLAELIRRSLELNGVRLFAVHAVACSDRRSAAALHVPFRGSGSASLHRSFLGAQRSRAVTVPTFPFDQLVAGDGLRGHVVVKLDIEGSEVAFLQGAAQFLRSFRPALLFELNPSSARAAGHRPIDLLLALRALGYNRFSEVAAFPTTTTLDGLPLDRQLNVVALSPRHSEAV